MSAPHIRLPPTQTGSPQPPPSRPGTGRGAKGRKDTGWRPEPRRPPGQASPPLAPGGGGAGTVTRLASIGPDLPAWHGRGGSTAERNVRRVKLTEPGRQGALTARASGPPVGTAIHGRGRCCRRHRGKHFRQRAEM